MSIRSRFFIVFLIMALVPMGIAMAMTFFIAQEELLKREVDNLQAVAKVQEHRINEAVDRYLEKMKLVSTRRIFRQNMAEYIISKDQVLKDDMLRLMESIYPTVDGINYISLIDKSGMVVVSTRPQEEQKDLSQEDFFREGLVSNRFFGLTKDENNRLQVLMVGPLVWENQVVGVAEMSFSADTLVAITEDYTGLGESGEVVLAEKNKAGDALFFTPLRFDASAALSRAIPLSSTNVPIVVAINGEETVLYGKDTVDYRGKNVVAVTRYIDSLEWGIVVKMDTSEIMQSVLNLLRSYFWVMVFTAIIVFVTAYWIAEYVSVPINMLIDAAKKLQSGKFSHRIKMKRSDEFGLFADTFNKMAHTIEKNYDHLEEAVKKRTEDLGKAKARMEAMFSYMGEGLVFINTHGEVELMNDVAEKITGYSQVKAFGKKWIDLVQPSNEKGEVYEKEDILEYKLLHSKRVSLSASMKDNYFYQKSNGSLIAIAMTASKVRIKKEVIGCVVVFRNITHDKTVDQAKSEFVSLASHQLRSPLASINWFSEILLNEDFGKMAADQKKYVGEIFKSSRRMTELVKSLLNVSRIELGTFVVEPTESNIEDLASQVVNELKVKIQKKKIKFRSHISDDVPVMMLDQKLITMVIQNLLSNAVKYTPDKGRVDFNVLFKKKDSRIRIEVSDNGYGIPQSQHHKIFSKLFRADNVVEQAVEGTGLGLYIVKAVVDQSGGKIWFDSEEGKGATFYVEFPLSGMKKKTGTKSLSA